MKTTFGISGCQYNFLQAVLIKTLVRVKMHIKLNVKMIDRTVVCYEAVSLQLKVHMVFIFLDLELGRIGIFINIKNFLTVPINHLITAKVDSFPGVGVLFCLTYSRYKYKIIEFFQFPF